MIVQQPEVFLDETLLKLKYSNGKAEQDVATVHDYVMGCLFGQRSESCHADQ